MKRIYLLLLPLLLLALNATNVVAQNVVAEYTFSGNAKDVSGYNNDASINGATFTQDRFGIANQAVLFDGLQSRLVANNAPQLQSATTTVAFWVRVDEVPAQGEVYLMSH